MKLKTKLAANLFVALAAAAMVAPAALADELVVDATGGNTAVGAPAPDTAVKVVDPKTIVGRTFNSAGNTYKVTSISYGTWKTGKATVALTKRYSSSKTATVPSTVHHAYSFSADGGSSAAGHNVTFAVTEIGAGAFNNSRGHKITKLSIGKNVSAIGDKAFRGCKKLKKITIKGDKIMKVGSNQGTLNMKKLYKVSKKWKKGSAFKGVPRTCTVTTPKPKGTDFGYVGNVRQLFSCAGFKGVVKFSTK